MEISLLLVASFANIFSQSVGYLCVLSMVSSLVQKLLSLIWPRLFIFAFISVTQETNPKEKYCCDLCKKGVLSMFSSRSFIVYSLTFRSLTHFEFIFTYGVREFSNL